MKLPSKQFSLKQQILRYFVGFALVLSLVFSAINFLNLYAIEDDYFDLRLEEEAQYLKEGFVDSGQWPPSRVDYIRLYNTMADFPEDIKTTMLTEPNRVEVDGTSGRYFHIYRFNANNGPFLLAEVSEQLLIRAHRSEIIWFLLFWCFVMVLSAVLLALRLSKKAFSPLQSLTAELEQIKPSHLPENISQNYPANEIGQLASALDQSMQQIHQFIEREQHFTRDASHELRTPIAIIKTSTELLNQNKSELNPEQIRLLKSIASACNQMEQTITALLSLARQDTSNIDSKTHILPIVEKVIVQQSYLLDHKEVSVEVDIKPNDEMLIGKQELHIIMTNLISNAFQYTEHGEVTIQYQNNVLSVTDSGSGMDDSIKDKATEPLVKGEHSHGYGIGLSLVSRLCEHHGFTLTVHHLNKGTQILVYQN